MARAIGALYGLLDHAIPFLSALPSGGTVAAVVFILAGQIVTP